MRKPNNPKLTVIFLISVVIIVIITTRIAVMKNETRPISSGSTYWIDQQTREELSKRTDAGDATSAFRLYQFYSFTEINEAQGIYWLTRAAELEHAVAQYNLAYFYLNEGQIDLPKSKLWASKSLKNGNDKAAELLDEINSKDLPHNRH